MLYHFIYSLFQIGNHLKFLSKGELEHFSGCRVEDGYRLLWKSGSGKV